MLFCKSLDNKTTNEYYVVATGRNLKDGTVVHGHKKRKTPSDSVPSRVKAILEKFGGYGKKGKKEWPVGNCAEAHVQIKFGDAARSKDIVMSKALNFKNGKWNSIDTCAYCKPFYPSFLAMSPLWGVEAGSMVPIVTGYFIERLE